MKSIFLFFSGSGGEQQTEQEVGQVQTNISWGQGCVEDP